MSDQYSVGTALIKHFRQHVESTKEWAELTVVVNSALSKLSENYRDYREPVIILKSNKKRDILNLMVVCLLTTEKELKALIQLSLLENSTVKNDVELSLFARNEVYLKLYLVELVQKRGFNHLFSLINFKSTKDNSKSILSVLRFKRKKLGTDRHLIPEKRRIGVGYRDKGSLPSPGASRCSLGNVEPRESQTEIEKHRQILQDTTSLIEGTLQ